MTTFSELGVPRDVIEALARRGVTAPFPIQAVTIAEAMAGRDVCGRAPTGSGKTLAFAVPLAATAAKGSSRRPRALVLVPTRELAAQVRDELRPLAAARGRTVATFYGGTSIAKDQRALHRGVDIAIACPGRLADLVQRGDADLRAVDMVVVDEADRMADMGFLPEVKRLLDRTATNRQTLLFSATLDGDVDVLVRRYQRNPVRHEVAESAESCGEVQHFFWHAKAHERVGIAGDVVRTAGPAIIFTRTKHSADRVAKKLQRDGVGAAAIHGNRSQNQRERALADFASGRVATLVATDVAARGIHVDHVGVVVHFDPPATDKDYVHRSGRTGRAGADGLVVTLVPPDKARDVRNLQRALALPQQVDAIALERLAIAERPQPERALSNATDQRQPSSLRQGDRPGRQSGQQRRHGAQRSHHTAGPGPAKRRGRRSPKAGSSR